MKHAILGTMIVTLSSTLGCSSDPVDIGDDKTGEKLSDYAASWDGYAEAHEFAGGSSRVRIVLDSAGAGTVEFGDGPAVPPPDPDVGYMVQDRTSPYLNQNLNELVVGFDYTARNSVVESKRLRLIVDPRELYKEWCSMQSSYPDASFPGRYTCLPHMDEGGSAPLCVTPPSDTECCATTNTGFSFREDCSKIALCSLFWNSPCDCTASGCDAETPEDLSSYRYSVVRLDAALEDEGTALVGTLLIGSAHVTIRLTRH